MNRIAAFIILLLMTASIAIPVGISCASDTIQPSLPIAVNKQGSESFSISPSKYIYYDWAPSKARVSTTICNQTSEDATFDLGDGTTTTIKGNSSLEHKYIVNLDGDIIRVKITKLSEGTGIRLQEQLILKIVPKEGSD